MAFFVVGKKNIRLLSESFRAIGSVAEHIFSQTSVGPKMIKKSSVKVPVFPRIAERVHVTFCFVLFRFRDRIISCLFKHFKINIRINAIRRFDAASIILRNYYF